MGLGYSCLVALLPNAPAQAQRVAGPEKKGHQGRTAARPPRGPQALLQRTVPIPKTQGPDATDGNHPQGPQGNLIESAWGPEPWAARPWVCCTPAAVTGFLCSGASANRAPL